MGWLVLIVVNLRNRIIQYGVRYEMVSDEISTLTIRLPR